MAALALAVEQIGKPQGTKTRAQMLMMGMQTAGGCAHMLADPNNAQSNLLTAAFCDNFDTLSPGGRGGDLDERKWDFSRLTQATNLSQGYSNQWPAAAAMFCTTPIFGIAPDKDSFFCGEQFNESNHWMEEFHDSGGIARNDARPRQPFDFANRTGTIGFEMDAVANTDLGVGHGYWLDTLVTDESLPVANENAPGIKTVPKNGVLMRMDGCGNYSVSTGVGPLPFSFAQVTEISVFNNYVQTDYKVSNGLLKKPTTKGLHTDPQGNPMPDSCIATSFDHFNDIQMRLSQNHLEIWASDNTSDTMHGMGNYADAFPHFRKIAEADNLNLPFTRGFVHFEHVQYNAGKQCNGLVLPGPLPDPSKYPCLPGNHTYHWDNLGFDGPVLPMPRSYEIPDSLVPGRDPGSIQTGYKIDTTGIVSTVGTTVRTIPLTFSNVDLSNATDARLNFNFGSDTGNTFSYSFNNGPSHTVAYTNPAYTGGAWRTISVPISLAELHAGDNTVKIVPPAVMRMANMDLEVNTNVVQPLPSTSVMPTATPMPTMTPVPSATACAKVGDINGDCMVNASDLSILLADWGTSSVRSDLTKDGIVNAADYSMLLSHWGT